MNLKKVRPVYWVCECAKVNYREMKAVINDDVCDSCGKHVHEPCLEAIIEKKETNGKPD